MLTLTDSILFLTFLAILWYSVETRKLRKINEEFLEKEKKISIQRNTFEYMARFGDKEFIEARRMVVEKTAEFEEAFKKIHITKNMRELKELTGEFLENTKLKISIDMILEYYEIAGELSSRHILDRSIIKSIHSLTIVKFFKALEIFIRQSQKESEKSWTEFEKLYTEVTNE